MKLKKSLKMVIINVLIFLDIYFIRDKDLECRISYGSGYIDNGSFTNKERKKDLKMRNSRKDSHEKSLGFLKRENYDSMS